MRIIYDNIQYALSCFGIDNFMTKQDVYCAADIIRIELEKPNKKSINPFSIIFKYPETLKLQYHSFDSDKIGGFIIKNNPNVSHSLITLNDTRAPESIKFNCCHELVHFFTHPCDSYTCASFVKDLDPFEYQANEGAAELLAPYRDAVPFIAEQWELARIISEKEPRWGALPYAFIILRVSQRYDVSEWIAEYRISSLTYEAYQYINGKDIDHLDIISKRKQDEMGIELPPLSTLCRSGIESLVYIPKEVILDCSERYQIEKKRSFNHRNKIDEVCYVTEEEKELLDRLKIGE